MKKIIMILCAVLFVSTCGKTTDQQIRESMVGDWVGCKNADTFSIKLTMSTVYGDDASTGTMTMGY